MDSLLFFHRYGSIVRDEVVKAVQAVFALDIPIEWKKTLITLISKRSDAYAPRHFRLVSLCTTLTRFMRGFWSVGYS